MDPPSSAASAAAHVEFYKYAALVRGWFRALAAAIGLKFHPVKAATLLPPGLPPPPPGYAEWLDIDDLNIREGIVVSGCAIGSSQFVETHVDKKIDAAWGKFVAVTSIKETHPQHCLHLLGNVSKGTLDYTIGLHAVDITVPRLEVLDIKMDGLLLSITQPENALVPSCSAERRASPSGYYDPHSNSEAPAYQK